MDNLSELTVDRASDTWAGVSPQKLQGILDEACLVHIYPSGPNMGKRYPLIEDETIMGRSEACEICVPDHAISRNHAKIVRYEQNYYIQDLGSLNGSYINSELVRGKKILQDGDYVGVGNAIFRFLLGGNIEADYHEEIYRLTILDGLTQLHNNRSLTEFLDKEVARSARHLRPLSVLIFDIDRFKLINDNYGHLCGDFVLKEFSKRINAMVRKEDLFARKGGEEFVLVLVETPIKEAMLVADRLREEIAKMPFSFESQMFPVTVSVGVSTLNHDKPQDVTTLMREADEKLYQAKQNGRNKVVA